MGKRKNAAQSSIMIEFMHKHSDLAKGFIQGDRSDVLWKKLSVKLNENGPPYKTLKGWRKAWNDWKDDVRGKLNRKQINDSVDCVLSAVDEGVARVAGLYEIVDSSFTFVSTNSVPASEASPSENTFEFDPDYIKQEEIVEEETKIIQEALNDASVLDIDELGETFNLETAASSTMKRSAVDEFSKNKRKAIKLENVQKDSSNSPVEALNDASVLDINELGETMNLGVAASSTTKRSTVDECSENKQNAVRLENEQKHTSMSDDSDCEIVDTFNIYEVKMKVGFGEYKIIPYSGKSKVWKIFGRIDKGGSIIDNLVACMFCNSVCTYNNGSTSNLVKHKCYRLNEAKPRVDASNETKNLYQHESESESSEIMSNYEPAKVCDIKVKILNGEYKIIPHSGKSKVWKVFGKIDRGGSIIDNVVGCMICNSVCSFNNSTTSNLVKHKCYRNLNEGKPKVDVDTETKSHVIRIITEWTIKDCRLFTFIKNDYFKQLVNLMLSTGAKHGINVQVDIDKILPPHSSVLKRIDDLYDSNYNAIKLELNELIDCGFGLTADLWSDNFKRNSYLTLIIHFIKNAKICNKLIALKSFDSKECSNEQILRKITAILQEFNCNLNKALIVTNNNSEIETALGTNDHIICISHLLNDIFEKSVQESPKIEEMYLDCTKLVKYLKNSEVNERLAMKFENSSETSSNSMSMFSLLEAIQSNWIEIGDVLQEKNELCRIDGINMNNLDAVTKLLKHFEDTSKELTAENNPTLHLTIVHIYFLKRICEAKNSADSRIIKTWKQKLVTLLNEFISNKLTIFHKIALFLFPPTSKLTQFTNVEKEDIKKQCKQMMEDFTYEPNLFEQNEDEQPQTESLSSANELLFFGVYTIGGFKFNKNYGSSAS